MTLPQQSLIPYFHKLPLHGPSFHCFPLVAGVKHIIKDRSRHFNISAYFSKTVYLPADMAFAPSYDYEEDTQSDSPTDGHAPKRPHKGGKHIRE